MSRDDTPWWLFVLAAVVAIGFYAYMSQPERYDECRERCAAKGFSGWTYDSARGCMCGGSTK